MKNQNKLRPVIIGQFSPPQLACIRSWGRQGFDVGMVCLSTEEKPLIVSRYLKDFVLLHPDKLFTKDGFEVINDYLKKFNASGITCLETDTALWINENKNNLPAGIDIWLPPNTVIRSAESKEYQISIAKKMGFNVLPTYFVDKSPGRVNSIPVEYYPLCLRPSVAAAVNPGFKVKLINNPSELADFVESLYQLGQPLIAQPYVNGPNLVIHGSNPAQGNTSSIKAFIADHKFEGLALTFSPTRVDKTLLDKCQKFADYLKITGCYHFDLLFDPGKNLIFFLEINCRLGGTTAKVYRCGYDEPLSVLQAYGLNGVSKSTIRKISVSNKQAILKFMYLNFKGKLSPLDYPLQSKFKRFFFAAHAFFTYPDEVWDWHDLAGSCSLYFGNLLKKIKPSPSA